MKKEILKQMPHWVKLLRKWYSKVSSDKSTSGDSK